MRTLNKKRQSPPLERQNLNLEDKAATRHWIKKWGGSVGDIQRAIDTVGSALHAVAKELGRPFDVRDSVDA